MTIKLLPCRNVVRDSLAAPMRTSRQDHLQRFRLSLPFLFLALVTCSCTLRLIGEYDDVIDKGLTEFQQNIETYLSKLVSTPSTALDQSVYDSAHGQLLALKSRAQASFKKDILAKQLDELLAELNDLQALDKTAGRPIPNPAELFKNARSALDVTVESILKLELALKRGKQSAHFFNPRGGVEASIVGRTGRINGVGH